MTKEVVTVNKGLSVNEAFRHVQELPEHHHAYPVVDGAGRLVGLFTLNDLKRTLVDDRGGARLSEVISKNLEKELFTTALASTQSGTNSAFATLSAYTCLAEP